MNGVGCVENDVRSFENVLDIGRIPRKFARSKEFSKCHAQGCFEVDSVEVIPNLVNDFAEDGRGEGEPQFLFPFSIKSFPSPDDKVDPWVIEDRSGDTTFIVG